MAATRNALLAACILSLWASAGGVRHVDDTGPAAAGAAGAAGAA
eukprot:CAMPEP_0179251678 /NCGR_PEP_ID=MMETSP0797-20121207/21811_1 /TAXON_ID=47934 /ORGANISM="Dinophysis acuminata, Strain DAEP01" /LENGTH=43 /DNA_ID= /DNA_START= /DNA_END= /DNA_ORIENTATION=